MCAHDNKCYESIGSLEEGNQCIGIFSVLKYTVDEIQDSYAAAREQGEIAQLNDSCKQFLRRKILYFLRIADAQAFFFELQTQQYPFKEDRELAFRSVRSLIGLEDVLDVWKN